MSFRTRAHPASRRLYYGWIIAAIAGLAYFFSGPGQTYSISIFIDGWMTEFGWTRTELSGLYSTATLLAGFTMVVVGGLVDRFGARAALVTVALLFAGASLWVSQAHGLIMLFVGLILVRILGQGSLTLIPYSLVPQLLVITGIQPMVGTGAAFHHMSLMAVNGLSPTVAALVFTVSAAVSFPATMVSGYASDRIAIRYMLGLSTAFTGVATLWLLITVSPTQAVVLGVLRGLGNALTATVSGVVWPAYFGRDNLASLRGAATTAMVVASALGPLPFGVSYDQTGSYLPAVVLMTGISVAGALVAVVLKPPHPRRMPATAGTPTTRIHGAAGHDG